MKLRKIISLLFLFAFAVVLAHSIIPHQHDDELCLINNCGNQHSARNHHDTSGTFPWHCHALSHVVLFEQKMLNKIKILPPFLPDLLADQTRYTDIWFVPVTKDFGLTGTPIPSYGILHLSKPRAPPSLSWNHSSDN